MQQQEDSDFDKQPRTAMPAAHRRAATGQDTYPRTFPSSRTSRTAPASRRVLSGPAARQSQRTIQLVRRDKRSHYAQKEQVTRNVSIERGLRTLFGDPLADTSAVLINGARQTGKSILVRSTDLASQTRQYLTFDDPGRDPNGLIAALNLPVTLDEVQHVPELFPVIKAAIDRNRQPGQFLLTGSANVMLLPKLRIFCAQCLSDL